MSLATAGTQLPSPEFILRVHAAQINSLSFSRDGYFLASGDAEGYVCVWNLSTFRPLLLWKAHTESVLEVHEWGSALVTHGRDNFIHVFDIPRVLPSLSAGSASIAPSLTRLSSMSARCSLPTNALAYCKAAFLTYSTTEALVATPAVLSDELIDICHLPSCTRVSRSIGKDAFPLNTNTGTVMALALIRRDERLLLLGGYEDGRLALFTTLVTDDIARIRMDEGEGWTLEWSAQGHKEPIMSMAISPDCSVAWTVAADHFVSCYNLSEKEQITGSRVRQHETRHPGRSSIAVRDDNLILAIGGWDGKVRVHSVKTFKPLAVLDFHRDSVYVVAFSPTSTDSEPNSALEQIDGAEPAMAKLPTRAWLATAGKDQRISLWELYPIAAR